MIGLIHPTGYLYIPRAYRHSVWLIVTNNASDIPAETNAVLQYAIYVIEKANLADADRVCSRYLFSSSKFGSLIWRASLNTGSAASQNQIGNIYPALGPCRNGSGGSIFDIIGMCDYT